MAIFAQLVDGVVVNKFELNKQVHTLGRHHDNDIVLDDVSVSSNHALIEVTESDFLDDQCDYFIVDQGSTNGTFVNDLKVEKQQLHNGDMVRIAWNHFKFINEDEFQSDQTVQILQD